MLNYWPSKTEFARLAATHNTVPVYCQLVADHLTPVAAFARISENAEHAFLLESVVGGEKIARYSFLSAGPASLFVARGSEVTQSRGAESTTTKRDDPLADLERLLADHRAAHLAGLPRFLGGAVGYAAYDAVRYVEHLPDAPRDDRELPDLLFGIYETMIVFDHASMTIKVVSHARVDREGVDGGYDAARKRIDTAVAALVRQTPTRVNSVDVAGPPRASYRSNFERADFERAVEACKAYIRAGDVFQVVLSQRLEMQTHADPFSIYRALRIVNPSPFMFYLKSPDVVLVGSSPEIMCRVEDSVVTNRPLAGTRRRGETEDEDRRLERELLADPKERAEHVMLVDLGRNDVGRVAVPGSVVLSDVMTVERYSHVMHLCSNVSGRLAPGRTAFDALRAALPVGTVTGAPKVRAMQIIDEFEPTRRGPYAGAVGYVDFAGNMDTCIALRTLVVTPAASGWNVYVQAGAGIVADSDPASEFEETINKAAGMLKAVEIAESQIR